MRTYPLPRREVHTSATCRARLPTPAAVGARGSASQSTATALLQLQRTAGNRAVTALIGRDAPPDVYGRRDASREADQPTRGGFVQRHPATAPGGMLGRIREIKRAIAGDITITASVGSGGGNLPADVRQIQLRLVVLQFLTSEQAAAEAPTGSKPIPAKKLPRTIEAIKRYQSEVVGFRRPDGQVSPGGRTQRDLAAGRKPPPAAVKIAEKGEKALAPLAGFAEKAPPPRRILAKVSNELAKASNALVRLDTAIENLLRQVNGILSNTIGVGVRNLPTKFVSWKAAEGIAEASSRAQEALRAFGRLLGHADVFVEVVLGTYRSATAPPEKRARVIAEETGGFLVSQAAAAGGAWLGAWRGAWLGLKVGARLGPWGAAVGAAVGALVGELAGTPLGKWIGRTVYKVAVEFRQRVRKAVEAIEASPRVRALPPNAPEGKVTEAWWKDVVGLPPGY